MKTPTSRLAAAALAATALTAAANASVVIDFDTDGLGNTLNSGTGLTGNEYANLGVTISAMSPNNSPLNLFASNTVPATGGDPDLTTGPAFDSTPQGNVLILQDLGDNPISTPDDDEDGGTFIFDFAGPGATLHTVGLLDLDEPTDPIFQVTFVAGGTQTVSASNITLENPAFPGDNSLRFYDFTLAGPISSLSITLPDISGAITGIEFTPIPTPGAASLFAIGALAATRRRRSA